MGASQTLQTPPPHNGGFMGAGNATPHPIMGAPQAGGMMHTQPMLPPNYGGVPRPLVGGSLPGGAPAASGATSPVLGNTQNIQQGPVPTNPQALAAAMGRMQGQR